jgi:hypothetical protein
MAVDPNSLNLGAMGSNKDPFDIQVSNEAVVAAGGTDFEAEIAPLQEEAEAIIGDLPPPAQKLEYPLDKGAATVRAAVIFREKKIDPAGIGGLDISELVSNFFNFEREDKQSDGADTGDQEKTEGDTAGDSQETNKNNQEAELKNRVVNFTGQSVTMYLPVALNITDSFAFENVELGTAGAAMMQGLSSGGSIQDAILQGIKTGAGSITDILKGTNTGDQARLAAVRGAQRVNKIGAAGDAVSLAAAVSVNPNIRSAFRNVALREFQFTFKFIPKSPEEAQMVKDIIKLFRAAAYPESINIVDGVSGGYVYPHLFDVSFKYAKEDGSFANIGTRLKDCYIRSINTTYNPGSMAYHDDGTPAEIDLSISLIEEKTVDRADVLEGGF